MYNVNDSVNSQEANTTNNLKNTIDIVVDSIKYDFIGDCLLKPLDEIMVTKEVTTMVEKKDENGKLVKDEEGNIEYETIVEVKDIPSVFRKGIVLKMPIGSEMPYKVGDTVLYVNGSTKDFDLFKDSVLVKPFTILGISHE